MSAKYRLRWAYNGAMGLQRMNERRPDLIMLDIMMPQMDGFGFLRAMRAHEPWNDVPVLIVTASDYGADLLAGEGSSIQAWRQRGWSTMETVNCLQALLSVTHADYAGDARGSGRQADAERGS